MNNTKDNLIAERDRLRAVNAALLDALKEQLLPRAKGWKVTDWDIRDEHARAAIAQAEQGAKGAKDGAS